MVASGTFGRGVELLKATTSTTLEASGFTLRPRSCQASVCDLDGGRTRDRHHDPLMGQGSSASLLDDHSRLAAAGICEDEAGPAAAGVLHRTVAWFTARGITACRVLINNDGSYCSREWSTACTRLGFTSKRTRPVRRQRRSRKPRPMMTGESATAQL